MLRETNPILLGVTFTVSIVHSIFDFLAFSNGMIKIINIFIFLNIIIYIKILMLKNYNNIDVKFWKERKDMVGLSFRSLIMNIFTQTVVFLYLLDNETSWMVIISNAVGLVIEIWKIHKVVNIRVSNIY